MKKLPYDQKAEIAILGEIISGSCLSYAKGLKPEDFYENKHKIIFRAMQNLEEKGEQITLITLGSYLKNKNDLEKTGGYSYLAELSAQAIGTTSIPSHIRIIKEEAIKRQILDKTANMEEEIISKELASVISEMGNFYTGLALALCVKNTEDEILRTPPISLPEFLKKDIPSIEYYVESVLQKEGRTMISAATNTCKSFFLQNLALAITTGKDKFLDKFSVTQGRVLYLDLEMGESALSQRFQPMCKSLNAENLFIKYLSGFDLLNNVNKHMLEKWISDLSIDVLMIDPIGDAWVGDEKDKQEVAKLTSYLDILKNKHNISIVIAHHWRKKTKGFKSGGEMASGSYQWGAWLDHHITLAGDKHSITVSCEKSRNSARFTPFIIKLDDNSLTFQFVNDFERKFTEETLINVFDSFGAERVKVVDACKRAEEQKICSEDTLRKLIKESKVFEVDDSQKAYVIYRKEDKQSQQGTLFNTELC